MKVLLVKQRVSISEPPFLQGELRGNVCDSSLASWKALSRLPIGYNCTFLLALTAETLKRLNRPLLKGWVSFGAKYQVQGLRLLPTYIHRQIEEWVYYNYAAGRFHMKKLCSRLYSIELEFYSQKRQIMFLSHSLREIGATYTHLSLIHI